MRAPPTLSTPHFVHGRFVASSSPAELVTVVDAATEQIVSVLDGAGGADVEAAVLSARNAFESRVWSGKSGAERAVVLRRHALRLCALK